jgi:hypothetical protein
MPLLLFDSGEKAVDIAEDGTGFVYYKNKKTAISIIKPTSTNTITYGFSLKGKCILVFNSETGVGFCGSSKVGSGHFTTTDCTLIDIYGQIAHTFPWNSAYQLDRPFIIELNSKLNFILVDKSHMKLSFREGNISKDIEFGYFPPTTTTSYLMKSKRDLNGKMDIQLDNYISLLNRQKQFNELQANKKNLVKPKSSNLTLTSSVVQFLEDNLDPLAKTLHSSSSPGILWKAEAFSNTIKEVPTLTLNGSEVGLLSGLGTYIYDATNERFQSPTYLLTSKGTFKNDVEVLHSLQELNPPLRRGNMICCNSGRYSSMLLVDRARAGPMNPTGMVVPCGSPLSLISWIDFKNNILRLHDSKLHVALVTRQSDPKGYNFARIAEKTNADILADVDAKSVFHMYLIDVARDNAVVKDLHVQSLPVFIMYYNGSLVYSGMCGGDRVPTTKPRAVVLVIEPDVKHQPSVERSLRRLDLDTVLCLNISDAIKYLSVPVPSSLSPLGPMHSSIRAVLISSEVKSDDISVLTQRINDSPWYRSTFIVAMVSVFGEGGATRAKAVKWDDCFATTNVRAVVSAPMSSYVKLAVQKPLKPSTVQMLSDRITVGMDEIPSGLSPESLLKAMRDIRDNCQSGSRVTVQQRVGIKLSTDDLNLTI